MVSRMQGHQGIGYRSHDMGEAPALGAVATVGYSTTSRRARRERLFFSGMAIAFAVVVFLGFAPTYYLRALSDRPALSPLVHLHGVLFSAWILLLLVQTNLVAMKRTDLHRTLGVAGGALAALMCIVGYVVAISAGRRSAANPGDLKFLIVPVGALIVFPALVGAAFLLRRRVDFHKRLMLIATIELMNAAVDRLPGVFAAGLAPFYPGTDLFLIALAVYDAVTLRRLHPATVWGGLFLVVMQWLRVTLMDTSAWLAVARWLTG
jgi:hypothetical protein